MKLKGSDIERQVRKSYDVGKPDCWDKIESADIGELSPLVENKKRKKFPLYLVAVRAMSVLLIVNILILAAYYFPGGLSDSSGPNDILSSIVFGKDTPVRVGKSISKPMYAKIPNFKEAYEAADLIAEVIIAEWLGEFHEIGYSDFTYFRAYVIEKFKDDIDFQKKEIILLQNGNSYSTHSGNPLFKNGDRLLLFLNSLDKMMDKEDVRQINIEGKDCFWRFGPFVDMQIVEIEGRRFALKRDPRPRSVENLSDIKHLELTNCEDIIEMALNQDELFKKVSGFSNAFLLDDLINEFKNIRKGDKNE